MAPDSQWQVLKVELRKEARSIFYSRGDVVLIELNKESDLDLTLSRKAATLKITFVPELNAVRWETEKESGFELIAEPMLDWLQLS